jgi:hypothetical protein
MPKLVRVKLPTGAEASVGESFAKNHKLTVLKEPAAHRGVALPAKPATAGAEKKEASK